MEELPQPDSEGPWWFFDSDFKKWCLAEVEIWNTRSIYETIGSEFGNNTSLHSRWIKLTRPPLPLT